MQSQITVSCLAGSVAAQVSHLQKRGSYLTVQGKEPTGKSETSTSKVLGQSYIAIHVQLHSAISAATAAVAMLSQQQQVACRGGAHAVPTDCHCHLLQRDPFAA